MRAIALIALLVVPACVRVASAATPTVTSNSANPTAPAEHVFKVTAKKFEFTPSVIHLKLNTPVVIELTALDRRHGFAVPDLHIDEEITPGKPTLVHLIPDKVGTYAFHCSLFCGDGHEDMVGQIVIEQ